MSALRILSAGSTLHGLKACVTLAQQAVGMIALTTDHGHNIRDLVTRGEAQADVVVLPTEMIAPLVAKMLVGGSVTLGSVGISGVIRAGAPRPAIGTMADLCAAFIAVDAVLLTRAPTGDHLLNVIEQFGLRDVVAPKVLRFDTATKLNLDLARRHDNALGFAPETEIRAGQGVEFVGDIPSEIQVALPYSAAVLTGAASSDAARAFLKFLTTPPASTAFTASGVRPLR
ncbi:MAG: substrate-binding domain-containing protein [Xanthobacteraceae bacterium]